MRALAYLTILTLGICASATPAVASPGADAAARAVVQTAQNWQEDVLFYLFAAVTVVSALGVVFAGSVVRMAMWLFSSFGAVAMLFFLLQAHFLGVVQLLVYVGGILVLIVFGIMLTTTSPWLKFEIQKREVIASGAVCLGLFSVLAFVLLGTRWGQGTELAGDVPVASLGKSLLTDYLVPFEVASVLLLVVMIGAAYLAKQERS